jgi:hypothetical protein
LTSPPEPDQHAVPDLRRANFHHLRDTTTTHATWRNELPALVDSLPIINPADKYSDIG